MTQFVLGFRFRVMLGQTQVALIRKRRPSWQAGKLNGIGGKVEAKDMGVWAPQHVAMSREFLEETGVHVPPDQWRQFGTLEHNGNPIYLFVSHGDCDIRSTTDEHVNWYPLTAIHDSGAMRNLAWLVPMALDPSNVTALIRDDSPLS
jgi:8-oxo-dGTP diphosphatase